MHQRIISEDVSDEAQLEAIAGGFALVLDAPLVIYLEGPLGAGKTTFVRALLKARAYRGRVKSPSYGLLESYDSKGLILIHLDLYRVEDPAELEFLALRDMASEQTVFLIEWPRRGGAAIPPADVELRFSDSVIRRELQMEAYTREGGDLLNKMQENRKIPILE